MFLLGLASVLRANGLHVVEVAGWQSRTRSSEPNGYRGGAPSHVMVHHTASPPSTDGAQDVNYIISAPTAPIANLYIDRRGRVHVIAAGPTNTNGKGSSAPWGGGVPVDSMNSWAIGIECANNGVGEPWPAVQTDALMDTCAALCVAYAIPVHHVRGHKEWAPGRKIDPAGPSPWSSGNVWNMDAFRGSVALELHPPTIPPVNPPNPPTDEDTMRLLICDDGDPATFLQAGIDATWVRDEPTRDAWVALGAGQPVTVPRRTYDALILNGPAPVYGAGDPRPKTVPADFAAHRP